MGNTIWILASLGLAVVLAFLLDAVRRRQSEGQTQSTREAAERALSEARSEAEAVRKAAELRGKEAVLKAKDEFEQEVREQRKEILGTEKRLGGREETLDRRTEQIDKRDAESKKREQAFKDREQSLSSKQEELENRINQTRQQLEETAGLTRDEARKQLVTSMVDEARHEAAKQIRLVEQDARETSDRQAKKIVSIAIERLAGEFVAERTVSVVHLPSDDLKGRIIGREGRNIRALEAATGVDLIIDDTPEAVVISCFNPIRREIAKRALERLISDGRIHPGRIEEVVRKAEESVEESVREAGQKAVLEVGIHGVHPEIVKLLGMLQYRYSYAQNVLMHSIEAAFICGAMAAELGLNDKQARRAALLHDIGK
ncbi:MAG: ribonuclease Y, partial [Thermoanaerobaculia bacterium]